MQKHEEKEREGNVYHRLPLKWWELLAYVAIIAVALVLNAMRSPGWVVVPLVLMVLLVRIVRILLAKRKKARSDKTVVAPDND
ncbi:hypothetical protein [Bifidobacterium parmae]|uniref:Uncharacterized protein n=1 Tax=Bifidobacterium parmae TaxID=361854 RepID=A0A2N5IWU3_9BIFI|nr:hypothetical protein [Bifidobacterium parmae]PLS26430.1 hypothetical protein Uis4E_2005 [Bifidobacterium parmae]